MSFRGQTFKYCRRSLRAWLQIALVMLLCLSLGLMGTLFWVDNSWALIADSDPATQVQLSLLLRVDFGDLPDQLADEDGDGVLPIAGGFLVRGNGDQDDNREEAFFPQRPVGALSPPPAFRAAVDSFGERRTVAAYMDFGHLKVMPAAEALIFNDEYFSKPKAAPLYDAGGLWFFNDCGI